MATNNFDSGHAIVPMMHTSGEVHNIAVPDGTDMNDFHAALGEAGYHHDLPQPTREGAIEFSPEFRKAAGKAVGMASAAELKQRMGYGKTGEAGFTFDRDGKPSDVKFQEDATANSTGHVTVGVHKGSDLGLLHTHDARHIAQPSEHDKDNAKNIRKVIMVASREGLFEIDPEGKVEQVFKSPTWYQDKEPK